MNYTICGIEITDESALKIAENYRDTCLTVAQETEFRFGKEHWRTRKEYQEYHQAVKSVNLIKGI